MFEATFVWMGIALLLAPILAEYGKIKKKGDKGFIWLGAGGASYLLAAAFNLGIGSAISIGSAVTWGTTLFSVIGLLVTLIGVVFVLLGVFK
ncbi:MAG: hypothetical protein KJ906_00370 [Nanoarchaeota archaeon]|nr:hypothetical protein [Nanoarchaeota archaeon]